MVATLWHGLLVSMPLICVPSAAVAEQKPNIVFVLMDNLGYGELGDSRSLHAARVEEVSPRQPDRRGHIRLKERRDRVCKPESYSLASHYARLRFQRDVQHIGSRRKYCLDISSHLRMHRLAAPTRIRSRAQ
jgi:hypothetical protein